MRNIFFYYVKLLICTMPGNHIDLNAGWIHRTIGGYPGKGHRMPVCCEAMDELMIKGKDIVLKAPKKGKGASLTIRYFRQNHPCCGSPTCIGEILNDLQNAIKAGGDLA